MSSTASDWSCSACTLLNPPSATACSICNTAKPAAGEQWPCEACTFLNSPTVFACIICNTKRPAKKEKKGKEQKKEISTNDGKRLPTILSSISKLYLDERFADVWFQLGRPESGDKTKIVPAHRAILAARSPVFRSFFSRDSAWVSTKGSGCSATDPIVIDDVDPRGFELMLETIYTDDCGIDDDTFLATLFCARKYQITALQTLCADFAKDQIHVGNACKLFQKIPLVLADQTAPLGFIEDHCTEVCETRGWLDLEPDRLEIILRCDNLMINEASLIASVVKWMEGGVGQSDREGRRKAMSNLLPLLRFPTLELDELADVVAPAKLLTSEEMLLCFRYAASKVKFEGDGVEFSPPAPEQSDLKIFRPEQYKARKGRGLVFKYESSQNTTLQRGIFYWLGTKRGKQPWFNPASPQFDAKERPVVATASSIANGDPSTATARNFENGYTRANEHSWFQLELKDILVSPTWYQISTRVSAGGSPLPLRNWRLEGKLRDSDEWTILSEHNNDQTLPSENSITRSFLCNRASQNRSRYFRIFRIFQHGSGGNGGHQLNFGNIELFGSVRSAR